MPVTTTSAAIHITPVVIKTLLHHLSTKGRKYKDGDETAVATDDVFFDEAFHIVKSFIELGTYNTVESLQAFTNTHVPAPYWAAVSPTMVPLTSCNKAADLLIDWFGLEELQQVVGGEKWWQVRGLDGIESEWVTEKEYLSDAPLGTDKKLSTEDANILRMEHLETVMLYVHGGAYFWGSINTHRYQIIRYARKIKGRAFAVNYRKAPQYPWPCPLQDVLAAYFYLTDPPPGSLHKPIPPSKIVLAGDSAGAGLCISALTVLRDMGIELPAGAVLISPWVDLTHSFPSVMQNTATDIIPPHGFIYKPSPIWPIHSQPKNEHARVAPTRTNPPPQPGHADTLRPDKERLADEVDERAEGNTQEEQPVHSEPLRGEGVQSQAEMMAHNGEENSTERSQASSATIREDDPEYEDALSYWEPKPPKVLMKDPNEQPLELRSQIQIYATNEQLTHPLVSPVLQGSLGNLCPLYIIAGDAEVLRDEIIYLAHKAAHPKDYPAREGVLREGRRQKENAEKFTEPTKVHLQVFDGMCHVLTVFTFTNSAKYAYRSIAEFVKHVTTNSAEYIGRNPFPEFHIPPHEISDPAVEEQHSSKNTKRGLRHQPSRFGSLFKRYNGHNAPPPVDSAVTRTDVHLYRENEEKIKREMDEPAVETVVEEPNTKTELEAGSVSEKPGPGDNPSILMIRERVDIFGHVRPMEPKEDMPVLDIPPRSIGVIKEDPVRRWLTGQALWDKKYSRQANHVGHRREHYVKKFETMMERARAQGLALHADGHGPASYRRESTVSIHSVTTTARVSLDRRYGPFDINDENPSPSSIVGRRDNRESIALLQKCVYFSAPTTHKTMPKRKTADAMRAAFDPDDSPTKPTKQSVSEQQTPANMLPMHGLNMWQSILTMFMRKSTAQAAKGRKRAGSTLRRASDQVRGSANGIGENVA